MTSNPVQLALGLIPPAETDTAPNVGAKTKRRTQLPKVEKRSAPVPDRPNRPATVPCWNCQSTRFWQRRGDGGWVCDVCHPHLPEHPVFDFSEPRTRTLNAQSSSNLS